MIGAKGVYVSGGEAQRISIARAMLKNASILILDEATAFADPDNEVRVQEAFARLSNGKTLIMIAHLCQRSSMQTAFMLSRTELSTHRELMHSFWSSRDCTRTCGRNTIEPHSEVGEKDA